MTFGGFLEIAIGLIQICFVCVFLVYWLRTRGKKTDEVISVLGQKVINALLFGGTFFVFLGFMYFIETTVSALSIGLTLIAVGCFFLLIYLPFVGAKWEATINMFAHRASFTLIIGGLILTILHFLNLMKLLPWWSLVQ